MIIHYLKEVFEMSVMHFHKDSFEKDVLLSSQPVLVDFWAPWCAPCRMLAPIVEEVADNLGTQAVVGKVNVDEEIDLASRYSVMSIPTLILFQGGKEVSRLVGVHSKEDILDMLKTE